MKKISEDIVRLMFQKYSIDISMFSDTFLENTIGSRITATDSKHPGQYIKTLTGENSEALLLRSSLSNSYSIFYRNPLTFSMLYQFVLPKIIGEKEKNHDPEIRIWSAGCASGQEAYSLAMLADDMCGKTNGTVRYRIFATDILTTELQTAAEGTYNFDEILNLPFRHIDNYFSRSGDTFTIKDSLKKHIEFSQYDLLEEASSAPPASIFGDFDLVMCSNLLFYYKPEFQKVILEKFSRSIREGGFLITGEAETGIVNATRGFRNYMSPAAVFVKG